jgi:hypothetical protein
MTPIDPVALQVPGLKANAGDAPCIHAIVRARTMAILTDIRNNR